MTKVPFDKIMQLDEITGQIISFFSKGVAWATRVSPNTPNQIIESAKELLLKFIPDVYIASDHSSKEKSGKSSGFGLVLTAETKSGTHYR